ncbi:aminoglycoside phosphotransferase family protein [Colwelliaceae bacterium 6441]
MEDLRQLQLSNWLIAQFSLAQCQLSPLNGDAGFRRYFRLIINNQSVIAVDSPVDKCNNAAFIYMQQQLKNAGINVPEVLAYAPEQGFMCLSDLGCEELSTQLNEQNMQNYYQQAISLLPKVLKLPQDNLPIYDQEFSMLELAIFDEWLLIKHLNIILTEQEQIKLQACYKILTESALEQPQAVMHRDFHSRNLMLNDNELAVIDFQDAVVGPVTYDIVSLLRDCYVKWPSEQVLPLFEHFIELIRASGMFESYPLTQWIKWFDLMGIQRHIKASGIFARLYHRDAKSGYLADIPLTLSYIVENSAAYPELTFLHDFVKDTVIPKLTIKMKEVTP